MSFAPIAIVGRACLLPGATTPAALFSLAAAGRVAIGDAPPGRWRVPDAHVCAAPSDDALDRTWTRRGGYVHDFVFDPAGYRLASDRLLPLDPLIHWVLDTGRRALIDAGVAELDHARTGAVLGNLSLPSGGSSSYAEQVWLGALAERAGVPKTDPSARFNSGLPAHVLAQGLGLGAGAFALDAACASSLYAVEDACRALQAGRADRMLAGAVNRADDLFIHIGFCALGAMSRSGQSRPFHADADGLVSGEGCGFVVLERLDDAIRSGRTIHGVIRGVGLANDGRGEGLLAPSERGQARSMRLALDQAGVGPSDVAYVECHATGTRVGDGTELASMASVYGETDLKVGSLKANLGHLITAAGIAGLIKVLGSMREGVLLPTPGLDSPSPALKASPFEALTSASPWTGPRRAGLSAFGFGGNDAHVIVEAYEPTRAMAQVTRPLMQGAPPRVPIVIVGLGARVGDGQSVRDLEHVLFEGGVVRPAQTIRLPMRSLRFPPNDLAKASAQQTMLLSAALEAAEGLELPDETTGVFVGYGCDPEIGRWGARWRSRAWGEALGADETWIAQARDAFVEPLTAAGVVGSLPNIPANRLSSQFDFMGPSFTVSAEELSGVRALEIAVHGLRRGDLDAALVGAVDLSNEPVHQSALLSNTDTADAALVMVLRRRSDAEREGLPIFAEVDVDIDAAGDAPAFRSGLPSAHAAAGLLEVASAALCAARGRHHGGKPWLDDVRALTVSVEAMAGQGACVRVTARGLRRGAFPELADERVLEFPAHLPPVVLPPLPTRAVAPVEDPMQEMSPAPTLPPTTFDGPAAPPPSAAAGFTASAGQGPSAQVAPAYAAPASAVAFAAPAPIAPAPAASAGMPYAAPATGWLNAHAAHQIRLADVHRAFLEQQTALHQQFLHGFVVPPLVPHGAPLHRGPAPVVHVPMMVPAAPAPIAPAPMAPAAPVPVPEPETPVAAPAPSPPAEPLPLAFRPRGPSFTREQLQVHSGGTISEIFGELFEQQDAHAVQVRMPEPPLLLADRVTGLDAEPGSMKRGTCWTETDVRGDSWYLHQGRMPTGIMIESGQADLFLISYLGADFENRGERAYRLLGCEMRWLGDLPQVGETLVYDIHVDGHAAQGNVRLFFFHYDCHIRRADGTHRPGLQVRNGQAGFFTRGELDESAGILWTPESQEIIEDARVDAPSVPLRARRYTSDEVKAFAAGRPWECFGEGFARAQTHTRTPGIQDGRMLFLDTVEIDPKGGPWGRGYLKAVTPIAADDWFFDGHFKNDPCMPGTLMLEGCVQAMAFYLTAMGYTVRRDGWRFQPIVDEAYSLRCRGQVVPTSQELTYEVFVEEVHDGPVPKLYADLLCTVDGLGAFHARRFGIELTPDWPLTTLPTLREQGAGDERAATASYEGGPPFRFDYPSLIACAWGAPSKAFGPMYERFDGFRTTARLPGPPYHFLSRVTDVDGELGGLQPGTTFVLEYDIPDDVWYWDENGARVMPFAVLLEAALQPCGWVASYVGSSLTVDSDLLFRNLDGKGTIKAEVFPDAGTLRTHVTIKNISASSGMIIESFDVHCYLGDTEVYELDTVFGFFPPEAFQDQAGLPTTDAQRGLLDADSNVHIDLTSAPAHLCTGTLRLADSMLLMIDRVTHLDRAGGEAGLGTLRAEKDVNVGEWFFKAHFYQDPVQPGSLGIEAMLQAMQVFMMETGMGEGIELPRFEAIATDRQHVWKYRGQVVPENRVITTTIEIVEVGTDDKGAYALADASLWVDAKRIYEAPGIGMRIVSGATDPSGGGVRGYAQDELLDPATDVWLTDHCPTYTEPALPMMSMVDRMMAAARAERGVVDGLSGLEVERWVVVDGPTRIKTEVDGDQVRLLVWREAKNPALSRYEVAAKATIGAPDAFSPLPALGASTAREPYADDRLFHGPAFYLVESLRVGATGSSATLDAAAGAVPFGHLNQGLLDAATHGILHDGLSAWSDRIGDDVVGYPRRLDVRFDGRAPTEGEVRCEARLIGFDDDDARFPVFRVQLLVGERVFADMRLVEVLMPKGPLGMAAPSARRAFLANREPVEGVGLSQREDGVTSLRAEHVPLSNWFPGTIRAVYGTESPREIAIAEHVASRTGSHPSMVSVHADVVIDAHAPLTAHPVSVEVGDTIIVRDAGVPRLTTDAVAAFWRAHFDVGPWPVEELYYGLVERFVAGFHVEDPVAFEALRGRGVLYLGNHQVGIESLIFSIVASALQGAPTLTLAKTEHRTSWLGELIAHCFTWPGVEDPGVIAYFDRADPKSLPSIVERLAEGADAKSLMVHVEGTRAHSARHRVQKMSGIFCDLAIEAGMPIVPVRFSGGLPIEPIDAKLEYPIGMGRQDYWLGRPIAPDDLAALPYKERIARVVDAINGLGPSADEETPHAADLDFERRARSHAKKTAGSIGLATLLEVLRERRVEGSALAHVLDLVEVGSAKEPADDPESRWVVGLARVFMKARTPET